MQHQRYRELLPVYDELGGMQREELDAHLSTCDECRSELQQLQALHAMMEQARPAEPGPEFLEAARHQLRQALRRETPRSLFGRTSRWLAGLLRPPVRLALGSGLVFAAGLGAGVLIVRTPARGPEQPPVADQTTRIENVRLLESDPEKNEVACAFDLVRPSMLRGSVADPNIQKVLVHALLNEDNPGTRLRSVSTLLGSMTGGDPEVKRAMIRALATDENPGVRQEALKALQRFPFDKEIKGALLGVLRNEKNAALRIAAINALDSAKIHEGFADPALVEALRQSMKSDDNNYVRVRSKSVLEEIKEQ